MDAAIASTLNLSTTPLPASLLVGYVDISFQPLLISHICSVMVASYHAARLRITSFRDSFFLLTKAETSDFASSLNSQ
jgi:hypothetical protein